MKKYTNLRKITKSNKSMFNKINRRTCTYFQHVCKNLSVRFEEHNVELSD